MTKKTFLSPFDVVPLDGAAVPFSFIVSVTSVQLQDGPIKIFFRNISLNSHQWSHSKDSSDSLPVMSILRWLFSPKHGDFSNSLRSAKFFSVCRWIVKEWFGHWSRALNFSSGFSDSSRCCNWLRFSLANILKFTVLILLLFRFNSFQGYEKPPMSPGSDSCRPSNGVRVGRSDGNNVCARRTLVHDRSGF